MTDPAAPAPEAHVARRTKPLGEEFTFAGDYVDLALEHGRIVEELAWSVVNNDDGTHTLVAAVPAVEA